LKLNDRYALSSVNSHQRTGGTVKKPIKSTILARVPLLVSIIVVIVAGIAAMWLTAGMRVFGVVILPTIVACLLVVYFNWRANLRRRILAARDEYRSTA
jgi:hypothetical protein